MEWAWAARKCFSSFTSKSPSVGKPLGRCSRATQGTRADETGGAGGMKGAGAYEAPRTTC